MNLRSVFSRRQTVSGSTLSDRAEGLPGEWSGKALADLEDAAIWTRAWVAVGVEQQIPDAGDLLPYTVGNHGIHVQRQVDGSLLGRSNKAQHGGCRAIPAQCQTGSKTRCSYTSCGYSRDRAVIRQSELESAQRFSHQYLGLTPERLLPVSVQCWRSVIMVNINPHDDAPFQPPDVNTAMTPKNDGPLALLCEEWIEVRANWKIAAGAPVAAMNDLDQQAVTGGVAWTLPAQPAALPFAHYPLLHAKQHSVDDGDGTQVFWLFPNLLVFALPGHVVCVTTQPTATDSSLYRVAILVAPDSIEHARALNLERDWLSHLRAQALAAERQQASLSSAPGDSNFERYRLANLQQCLNDERALTGDRS